MCIKNCSVDAIGFNKKTKKAFINPKRCIGCGNCVPVCKPDSLRLERRSATVTPPLGFVDMNDTFMRDKPKWRLGRIIKRTLLR